MEGQIENAFEELCTYENLEKAFNKARKRKTTKPYVIEFEEKLQENLLQLRNELLLQTYRPHPLKTFILRDPKTRKISKSAFRDRVVHHAICNIIDASFDKKFIFDSYANRFGKGTLKAIKRFDTFKRKVSKNNTQTCWILKADIKSYFESVDQDILLNILKRTIKDERVLWLIQTILANHSAVKQGKGMPLGNLTSQFFANVYLNELDQFVKHQLHAKYYVRYVDDFVILHNSKEQLATYKHKINVFLKERLALTLHPGKSKILTLQNGICFLGFRIFYHHKIIRKKNLRKFQRKLEDLKELYKEEVIERDKVVEKLEGWLAYASHGNTYKYRKKIISLFNQYFPLPTEIKTAHVKKHEKFSRKIQASNTQFTQQKTLQLFRNKFSIQQIAKKRGIRESTVWEHITNLIENNQCSIKEILPQEKINKIRTNIRTENDNLKEIKERMQDKSITYDEINCVLASLKCQNKKKNIQYLIWWYQHTNCYRKCHFNKRQRQICKMKLQLFASKNPNLELKRNEFLDIFNTHMNICVLPEKEKRRFVSWKEFQTKINEQLLKKKGIPLPQSSQNI